MKLFTIFSLQGLRSAIALILIVLGFSLSASAQCEIGAIEVTPTPCDTSCHFNLFIDFEYANVGAMGFTVQGNGGIYGTFEYSDLPIMLNDLECDGTTDYEFVVRDIEFPDCSNFYELGIVYCEGGPCNIWNVDVFVQPCEAGFFYVQLGFWHENTGSQGFRVQGNGNNYGNFEYADLPIMIGPLEGDGVTEYEFVVIDNEFEDCSDWAAIDPVECPGGDCNIWDMVVDDHPCNNDGFFYCYVNFEYENVSGDGFELYINDDLYGNFEYSDLPLWEVGPLAGDGTTIYQFVARDLVYEDCVEDANLGPIDCGTGGECEIGEIAVTILPCNDDDEFMVLLDFEYANTSDGFSVNGNGMYYGDFLYVNLPIEIGPLQGDGVTIYEFGVSDLVHDNCGNATAIDPVSCDGETALINLTTQVVSCNSEMYELQMNFEVVNGGSEGFMIIGNGEEYGSYVYSQLPVTIGPLATDGTTPYHFIAKDKEFQHYGNWDKLIPFTCESLGIEDPVEDNASVKVYPNPSNGMITFESQNEIAATVHLYNSAGAEVETFSLHGKHTINDLDAGMYYYRILGDQGQVEAGKIVVTM